MAEYIDINEVIINFEFEWDDIAPTREEFIRFLKKQSIIDAVPVVRCEKCVLHGNCATEDAFIFAGIENPFCCIGKWKGNAY